MTYKANNGVTLARSANRLITDCLSPLRPPRQTLVTLKCTSATKELIRQAAEFSGLSISAFVRNAVIVDAQAILTRRQVRLAISNR